MEFTGERYLASLASAQISYEHWHRYMFASYFTKNCNVLDIACGEGYGSAYLSKNAKEVIGVDISPETVEWAKKTYINHNLKFITGSCEMIPVDGKNIFDVIVSFETIEHIGEIQQFHFLEEVKRLLKPNGLFIVSTPNKAVYSDLNSYTNAFHIKEFYKEQFDKFLSRFFKSIALGGQKIYTSSWIWPFIDSNLPFVNKHLDYIDGKFIPVEGEKTDLYDIAICTDENILEFPFSCLTDLSQQIEKETYGNLINIINTKDAEKDLLIKLKEGNDVRINESIISDKEKELLIYENGRQIDTLNKSNQELGNQIIQKNKQLEKLIHIIEIQNFQIANLNIQLKEHSVSTNEHLQEVQNYKHLNTLINNSYSWKITQPLRSVHHQIRKVLYLIFPFIKNR